MSIKQVFVGLWNLKLVIVYDIVMRENKFYKQSPEKNLFHSWNHKCLKKFKVKTIKPIDINLNFKSTTVYLIGIFSNKIFSNVLFHDKCHRWMTRYVDSPPPIPSSW